VKNRILKAGISTTALGLCSLVGCLGSSSSGGDDAGSAQSSQGDDSSTSGPSPTSTSTTSPTGTSTGSPPAGDASTVTGGGTGVPLAPDPNGYLGPSSNSLGIQGAWYAYGDDWGTNGAPPGDCETKGMHAESTCSTITFPPAAMASDAGDAGFTSSFPQSTPGTMCLSGTAAKVLASDYTNMFGIGIGLDFNNQGGVKMPYDATMNHVVGFSFTIAGIPTGASVRVELPIPATDSSGDAWSLTVMTNGAYTVDLTTSASDPHSLKPSFTPTGTQPAFDATKLESIQFHVPTNITAAVSIPDSSRLCVSDFQAIVSGQ
jgi:hypothetical protein